MVDLWESCHVTPVNFYSEPYRYNVNYIHRGWYFWSCVLQWPQGNNSPITRCLKSVCRPSSSPFTFSFSSQYCFWDEQIWEVMCAGKPQVSSDFMCQDSSFISLPKCELFKKIKNAKPMLLNSTSKIFCLYFISLFLAVLGVCCWVQAFPRCEEWGFLSSCRA